MEQPASELLAILLLSSGLEKEQDCTRHIQGSRARQGYCMCHCMYFRSAFGQNPIIAESWQHSLQYQVSVPAHLSSPAWTRRGAPILAKGSKVTAQQYVAQQKAPLVFSKPSYYPSLRSAQPSPEQSLFEV